MTLSQIRLLTEFDITDYRFPWGICNGCGMPTGDAYPSGHLVPSPILGLANAPIVETKFLEFAMSLLDFSPRIPLGTFSILLLRSLQVLTNVFRPGVLISGNTGVLQQEVHYEVPNEDTSQYG